MKNQHELKCSAPICVCDSNKNYKNEVIWYPGEKVCSKTPHQEFQKKQIDINKWLEKGKFKNIDDGYTASDLETRSI